MYYNYVTKSSNKKTILRASVYYYSYLTTKGNSSLFVSHNIIGKRRRNRGAVIDDIAARNIISSEEVGTTTTTANISSIGFSGAGLLVPYQLGVVKALQDYGIWSNSTTKSSRIPLIGCSGGALTAVCISAGVTCDDGMNACLQVNSKLRQLNMTFDVLQPGFSLLDTMEPYFVQLLQSAIANNYDDDEEQFLCAIEYGKLLRIGLTDRRGVPPVGNSKVFYYANKYRNLNDIIASCMLSSYVPAVTGPTGGDTDTINTSIARASTIINDMLDNGCIVHWLTGKIATKEDFKSKKDSNNTTTKTLEAASPILEKTILGKQLKHLLETNSNRKIVFGGNELFWDGGLSNAFPYYDNQTLIISPVAVTFPNHPHSITPAATTTSNNNIRCIEVNPNVRVHSSSANAQTVRYIVFSSDNNVLERKFADGYDHAKLYMKQQGYII